MNPCMIVVTGYLASGKSTFALRLSEALRVPYLIKDTFKIALSAGLLPLSREDKSRFSAVTFDAMMYVAERLMEKGLPLIIEGNFVPGGVKKTNEAGTIETLAKKHACRTLTFKFIGDTSSLYKRFIDREKLPERGQANMLSYQLSYEEFIIGCRNLGAFSIGGKTVEVDTTEFEKVDFDHHIETARVFLK